MSIPIPPELESLRKDIKRGFDEIDRGEGIELDKQQLRDLFDDIKARGRDRYKAVKPQRATIRSLRLPEDES